MGSFIAGIGVGLLNTVFERKGYSRLDSDEVQSILRAGQEADADLSIKADPRIAALGNIGTAIATPIIKRITTEKPKKEDNKKPEDVLQTKQEIKQESKQEGEFKYPSNLEEAKKLYEKLSKEYG